MAAFSLLRLPLVPVKLVIGLMEVEDQIKLSMTSMKTEEFIKWINYFLSNFDIHLSNEKPYFNIRRTQQNYCDVRFNLVKGEKFDTKYLINWYEDQSDQVIDLKSMNPIDDVMTLSERLRPLFKIQFFQWKLELKKSQLMNRLPIIITQKCNRITILNGKKDHNLLLYIMDTVPSNIQLRIESDIPSSFKHKKALTFLSSEYKNGLWVTIEDLLSIRNRFIINLETTNFDCNDINRFLLHWANCEHNMMHCFYFNLRKGVQINVITLLHGLTYFQWYKAKPLTYIIYSKKDETKRLVGRIQFCDSFIVFSTWKKTDPGAPYALSILKMLHRQKELIAEYAEIGSEERLLKEEMKKEFYRLMAGLKSKGVTGYPKNINP